MNHKSILYLFIIMATLIAACAPSTPTAQVAADTPTDDAVPSAQVEPTAETTQIEIEKVSMDPLLVRNWQWVAFTSPVEQFDVEMPESYQLRFLDDGTIAVTADCNSAFIPYTDEAGSLTLEPGAMTLALCPGDSRSEQFIELLGGAARYFFEEGHLFIDLRADGGTLEFARGSLSDPKPLSAQTIPCPMNLPEGDIDGETMICGQIEVPENWDNPGERTLVITYAIAKANNESPFADPIIFFEGGPGISALEEIEWLVGNTSHLRMTRDIIFFDQRGIRFSSPLECPPEIRSTANEIELPEDVDVDAFSETINNVTLDSDVDALLEAADILGPGDLILNCAPYLEEQGVDLSQYSSYSNALDSIALMNALDYPSYNLYGISYGSNHTLEVMRYYDENEGADLPAVRSVVIDGVLGSWIDFVLLNALGRPVVVLNAFEACEADDACSASYPNIRQRAIDLLAEVEADPLVIDDSTTITLGDLNAVLKSNASDPAGLVYLPRLIDELEQGNADLYLRLQDGTLPVVSETLPEVSTPFDPISLEADSVASQMRILAEEVESLAALSQRLSEAYQSGVALPQFFADELADSAEQLPQAPLKEITAYFQSVPTSAPDRNQLLEAVSLFPEAERNLLISLVGLMDDEEIAEVYAILADPLYSERFPNRYTIIEVVIHCNDRVFDLASAYENLRAFDTPPLIQGDPIDYGFGARCAGYGVSGSPLDPVTNSSGFPVFVSNGAVDGLTPKIFGESIYANLENARMITFPNLGHGATRKSACSRDITNAFFMYPEREFNDACIETLRPVFVLPDEELPE